MTSIFLYNTIIYLFFSLFFCILQCSDDVLMHNSEDWVQQQNNFRDNYFSGKKQQQQTCENCDDDGGSVDRPIYLSLIHI